MERWRGKVAVVTGASSGIGAAIARKLVEEGLQVVGFARRKEPIDALAKQLEGQSGKLVGVKVDIAQEAEVVAAFKWVEEHVGPVHVLVNSAGVYRVTSLSGGDARMWRDVLDTNVLGLCLATREAVTSMMKHKVAGHVVHINSVGGHRIVDPNGSVCGASKYAVTALTEQLRQELNGFNSKIKVTSVSPGFVKTDIFKTTFEQSGIPAAEEVAQALVEDQPGCLNPEDLANAVAYVLSTAPRVQVHELTILPVNSRY